MKVTKIESCSLRENPNPKELLREEPEYGNIVLKTDTNIYIYIDIVCKTNGNIGIEIFPTGYSLVDQVLFDKYIEVDPNDGEIMIDRLIINNVIKRITEVKK